MAIDDNTTYGLTGAQVTELVDKIKAGKIKDVEVTAAATAADALFGDISTGDVFRVTAAADGSETKRINFDNSTSTGTSSAISIQLKRGEAVIIAFLNRQAYNSGNWYWVAFRTSARNADITVGLYGTGLISNPQLASIYDRGVKNWLYGQSASSTADAVLAWTSIGTGSSYTKRALQTTLNISEANLTIPADTWTSLGITMPTEYCPTITMLGAVTANNNGTFEPGLVRVNTDGTVEVHTSNATTDIYGSIVYPTAS